MKPTHREPKQYIFRILSILFLAAMIWGVARGYGSFSQIPDDLAYMLAGAETGCVTDRTGATLYCGGELQVPQEVYGNLIDPGQQTGNGLYSRFASQMQPSGFGLMLGLRGIRDNHQKVCSTLAGMDVQQGVAETFGDRNGLFFAMDIHTGEILSAISLPCAISAEEGDQSGSLINRCFGSTFVPASTMKVVLSLITAETNPSLLTRSYTCNYGHTLGDGNTIDCHAYHGTVDQLRLMLGYSCNSTASQIINRLNVQQANAVLQNLGFRQTPNLPGETLDGFRYCHSCVDFTHTDSFSQNWGLIGQGDTLVSAVDMTRIAAAVACDGKAPQPYLTYGITRDDRDAPQRKSQLETLISPDAAKLVRTEWMAATDEFYRDGTLDSDVCDDITMVKTGTAQLDGGQINKTLLGVSESKGIAFYVLVDDYVDGDPTPMRIVNRFFQLYSAQ